MKKKLHLTPSKSRDISVIILILMLGLPSIAGMIYFSAKDNYEKIEIQNHLLQTLDSYDLLQDATQVVMTQSSLKKAYESWEASKNSFEQNFALLLDYDDINNLREFQIIHSEVWKLTNRQFELVQWNIAGIEQNHPHLMEAPLWHYEDTNDFERMILIEAQEAIRNLDSFLNTTLDLHLKNLFQTITDQQKKNLIRRTAITIFGTLSIAILMMVVLLSSINSLRNSERKYLERSNQTMDIILKVIAHQAELRDSDTGAHLDRTSRYVEVIAHTMLKEKPYKDYITKQYIEDLIRASFLHDIGKIGIPDKILRKEGKLTPKEFEIMKLHCRDGADTLRIAQEELPFESFLGIAIHLTESHHENWDGSGYPSGLSKEEIPLSGRIMTVADVYDALRSPRPYKKSWGHEECIAYISDNSGRKFDPYIVEKLMEVEKEFERISNEV